MLPKTLRVLIFADGLGTLTAHASYELNGTKRACLEQRGFKQIAHMRAPLRRLQTGWYPLVQHAYRSLVHAYGL
jgi:hypothetical protein